jgi:hypothetical protein
MLAAAGCNGTTVSECVNATTGAESKYVANTLMVPQQRADYALDLNGDGKPDNQLGNIIGALTAQNLNTQDGVNKAIADGSVLLLMDEKAADLQNNDCGTTDVSAGVKPAMPPKYDGTDVLTIDTSLGGGTFKGKITGGTFNSNSPVTTSSPTSLTIQLPLVSGSQPVKLSISGAHIQFTKMGDGAMKGQINGGIKSTDVQNNIIPNVAMLLSDRVTAMPTGSTEMQILSIFDTGGEADPACSGACKNMDGSCAKAGDKKIDVCEVATNSIIKNVLAPDVQLFSDDGSTYKPNPANTHKDSLSLGLSFTAVKASF